MLQFLMENYEELTVEGKDRTTNTEHWASSSVEEVKPDEEADKEESIERKLNMKPHQPDTLTQVTNNGKQDEDLLTSKDEKAKEAADARNQRREREKEGGSSLEPEWGRNKKKDEREIGNEWKLRERTNVWSDTTQRTTLAHRH
jgi:hypothetical protein